MTAIRALAPMDISDEQLRSAGIDPDAARRVPSPLGFIHSDDITDWIGVDPIDGRISLSDAVDGEYGSWHQRSIDGKTIFVNATRLVVIEH